jgi:roadblock/LC7 domain-containing protein
MISRLLALDGVLAVCQFRDDGSLVEGYGLMESQEMTRLARFSRDYKRMLQGNADQLCMFTGMGGWTPPRGWVVRGRDRSVYSFANIVCVVDNADVRVSELIEELREAATW